MMTIMKLVEKEGMVESVREFQVETGKICWAGAFRSVDGGNVMLESEEGVLVVSEDGDIVVYRVLLDADWRLVELLRREDVDVSQDRQISALCLEKVESKPGSVTFSLFSGGTDGMLRRFNLFVKTGGPLWSASMEEAWKKGIWKTGARQIEIRQISANSELGAGKLVMELDWGPNSKR